MTGLSRLASDHQRRIVDLSDRAARSVVALWRGVSAGSLDEGWDRVAPDIDRVMSNAQINAAGMASGYAARASTLQHADSTPTQVVPQAFSGVTREGREVVPELFSAVTTTKTAIRHGAGVGQAFQAGTAIMSMLAGSIIRDTARDAGSVASTGRGALRSVRVIQPGACSRCAILAGVTGYREDFLRHPSCRCTSMPLYDDEVPDGFYRSPGEYFESLSEEEQDRIFTKSGAWAIRNGASETSVVNARRGAYMRSIKYPDGTFSPARLRPISIGVRRDGSPLMVYATREGTTARGFWGRKQRLDVRDARDRYRRTSTLRLMPEQIMQMSEAETPARARELLRRYGYIY